MLLSHKNVKRVIEMKLLTILFTMCLYSNYTYSSECPNEWRSGDLKSNCEYLNYQVNVTYPVTSIIGNSPSEAVVKAKIRAGYLLENKKVTFKGNILYLEGLSDSMLNHKPLFDKLTNNGFRVIAFDYMGQGGSTGTMNDTRLQDIPSLALKVYQKYGRDLNQFPKPIVVAWSTGGLAAYLMALDNNLSKVVLISPAIVPSIILGEQDICAFEFDKITLETLTSKKYLPGEYNPHVEGIRPSSPLDVKDFATNLVLTSMSARFLSPYSSISGLVLLSGKEDSYVKTTKNSFYLSLSAPNFKQVQFKDALHEIDNEKKSIVDQAQKEILNFLMN
jgi:alpha-beta hydrolase superfamily lysophospholipase